MKSNFSPLPSCGDVTVQQLICSYCFFLGHSSLYSSYTLTSFWMSAAFSYPKVINHQWSAAVKHQRICHDCRGQVFSPISIMQQLGWQCAMELESVAVVLLTSVLAYLCGASDCKKKNLLIKSAGFF